MRSFKDNTVSMRLCRGKGMMVELEVFDYDMDKAALIGPRLCAAMPPCTTHSNFDLVIWPFPNHL